MTPEKCELCGTVFESGKPKVRTCCSKGRLLDVFATSTPEEAAKVAEEYLTQGGSVFDIPGIKPLYKGVVL